MAKQPITEQESKLIRRKEALDALHDRIKTVDAKKAELKTARQMLVEHLENIELYNQLQTAKQAVEDAREKLNMFLGNDQDYLSLREGVDSSDRDLKYFQEVLGAEVLAYRDEFESRTVPIDDETERDIIITAKLGRKHDIQTEFDFDSPEEQKELSL